MDGFIDVLRNNGDFWAFLGAAIAFFLAGIGSTKGVGLAGETASGVVTEDPGRFVPVMILEALPSTQGIYGFVAAFMIISKVGGLPIDSGLYLLTAGLPIGIVGLISGRIQGRTAAACIGIVAKHAGEMVKGIVLTLMVEVFAVFALLVSILMIIRV